MVEADGRGSFGKAPSSARNSLPKILKPRNYGTTTMNATSQAAVQCTEGLGANFSVRTPNVPAGHRTPASGIAVVTSVEEREYSTDATHDRLSGSIGMLGVKQYSPSTGLVTLSKLCERAATRIGSVCSDTSGGTTYAYADTARSPFGPCGPCGPCAPVAPVAPVSPRGPVAPIGPAGPVSPFGPMLPASCGITETGSFAFFPSATSAPAFGVRDECRPSTLSALTATGGFAFDGVELPKEAATSPTTASTAIADAIIHLCLILGPLSSAINNPYVTESRVNGIRELTDYARAQTQPLMRSRPHDGSHSGEQAADPSSSPAPPRSAPDMSATLLPDCVLGEVRNSLLLPR